LDERRAAGRNIRPTKKSSAGSTLRRQWIDDRSMCT
jgi:hypothetical protein